MVQRFREKLSNEKLDDRLRRMLAEMERAADVADTRAARPAAPRRRRSAV